MRKIDKILWIAKYPLDQFRLMKSFLPALLFLLILPLSIFAQGSLAPLAGPAPTMKTLDQVEARIIINAANTPGDANNQFIINAPGSYYLTGNITGVSGKNCILINASSVTIDLNGFALIGSGLAGITSGVSGPVNIAVRNGSIQSCGGAGVNLTNTYGPLMEGLSVIYSGSAGMKLGDGCVVRHCVVRNNASDNIVTGVSANVAHCTAVGSVNGVGIYLQSGAATDCVVNYNNSYGISAGDNSMLSHCVATQNVGGGIAGGNGATVVSCAAYRNGGGTGGAFGIVAGNGCNVIDCNTSYNTVQYGILVNPGSILTRCTASFNTSALDTSGGMLALSSSVIGCTANSNMNSYATPDHKTGRGIYVIGASTIKNCTANSNKGDGINVFNNCVVTENQCNSNGADGIYTSGGSGNRVESNQANANSGIGIHTGVLDWVVRNTSRNNPGGNFVPDTGPDIAPIQTASTATNPFANLQ